MSGRTDAPVRCHGCGGIIPAKFTGMAAISKERPYSISDEFERYTMESDGLWRCGVCQTKYELREAWVLIESLQADREKDRAELAALRERVAKMEAALVRADELEVAAADVGHCPGCFLQVCDITTLHGPRLAYRAAREVTQ